MYFLRHRSIQIFILLALYLGIASLLPYSVHQGLYTISLIIKECLLWLLPITICFFISHAIASFEKKALVFVLAIIFFETFSNASSVWYAFACGNMAVSHIEPLHLDSLKDQFSPLFNMPLTRPSWWSTTYGMTFGVLLGLIAALFSPSMAKFAARGKEKMQYFLTHFAAKLIPLFVLGFVARMHETKIIGQICSQYGPLLLALCIFLCLYILILFALGAKKSLPSFSSRIRNLAPAGAVAFSSGCGLSTMPWTIEGTAKNLRNPSLAELVIPITTNIQQIGDCFINSFLCFLLYTQFFGQSPTPALWCSFSIAFVLARFATASVIGGAIFIMLPIYENYLHFTPEMIALILAFNVILDPLVTAANVIANGALCPIFEKIWDRISSYQLAQSLEKSID